MSYGALSDEVAEDYRKALEDLTMNSRYEISNLTVIAKENTEHALAISEALKTHIKRTTPQKKLPAFYVLDSVVKNVGTPYTLFFGRQLFSTFMEAYALVDTNVRRKMDEMLKTWKEPVPGSIDTRPVFPPEVTRPIENALIKARTSAVQAHQEHLRSQQQYLNRSRPNPSPVPYRETPTPPNTYRQPPPPQHGAGYSTYPPQQQYPPQTNGQQPYPNQPPNGYQQYPQPGQPQGLPPGAQNQHYNHPGPDASSWHQSQQQGYRSDDISVVNLKSDIDSLITVAKADFAVNPYDVGGQTRLNALLALQNILVEQELPQDQLALIKTQVTQLSQQAAQAASRVQAPAPKPVNPTAAPSQPVSLNSIFGPGALAALLARQSATPQPIPQPISQPIPQAPAPRIRSPQPSYQNPYQPPPAAGPPSQDASALLERLRAAGLLGGGPPVVKSPALSNAQLPLPGFPPPPFLNTPPSAARTPLAEIPNDVVLKATSLKIPRPHLVYALYDKLGAPCNQCGRRFQSDEDGKNKKRAHLDWHFRVNQRMSDAEKRGQHRSWYVDELEWIRSREVEGESSSGSGATLSASSAAPNPKLQYLPVPDDPALANSVCPICQERFEMKWLDEAQEFVWMDAKQVAGRIFHASCHAEAAKDVGARKLTPEPVPVLGKRKAEDDAGVAVRTKIKSEPVS